MIVECRDMSTQVADISRLSMIQWLRKIDKANKFVHKFHGSQRRKTERKAWILSMGSTVVLEVGATGRCYDQRFVLAYLYRTTLQGSAASSVERQSFQNECFRHENPCHYFVFCAVIGNWPRHAGM